MVEKALLTALVVLALVVGIGEVRERIFAPLETAAVALDSANDGPTRGWED